MKRISSRADDSASNNKRCDCESADKSVPKLLHPILFWGILWGLFEATAGFLLHLLPVPLGAYLWFPAAFFFMRGAHQQTEKKSAILGAAAVAAALKLLNLFSDIRPDYVLNPAASILLEALAMIGVTAYRNRPTGQSMTTLFSTASCVAWVNSLWRVGYVFYLIIFSPLWMRDASVVGSAASLLSFLLIENMLSSFVCIVIVFIERRIRAAVTQWFDDKTHA